jgi:RNA polymerase sigma-70 factor, ECF subfamily
VDEEQIQAISRLYERHAPAIHRYALRRSDADTAEEVTAQVFLVAWRRREDLPGEPLPWLYGVARRALADQRRGASRRVRLRDRLQGEAAGGKAGMTAAGAWPGAEPRAQPGTELDLPDRGLARALGGLSETDREALLLRYWEDLEPAQIARAMGCSRATAAVRLHRARTRLRGALEAQGAHQDDSAGHPCVEGAESA